MACSCMNNTTSSDGCRGSNNGEGAAKSDKHCELQDSVNQQEVERILLFGSFLKACLLQCLLFFLGGVSLGCHVFVFFMFQCSIRCIDTCVLVVLDMRNVEHLLQE